MISLLLVTALQAQATQYPIVTQSKPGIFGSSENLKCPIIVDAGHSIGPIHLGDDIATLEKTGLKILQVGGGQPNQLIVGRFSVSLAAGKVMHIEAEIGDLPGCVKYKKRQISRYAKENDLARLFPGCGKTEILEGGNLTTCKGVGIGTGGWGGQQKTPTIRIPR